MLLIGAVALACVVARQPFKHADKFDEEDTVLVGDEGGVFGHPRSQLLNDLESYLDSLYSRERKGGPPTIR